jgi:hypothetical protein
MWFGVSGIWNIVTTTHRVHGVSKPIEEKQLPLKGGHSDLVNSSIDNSHLPGQGRINHGRIENVVVETRALSLIFMTIDPLRRAYLLGTANLQHDFSSN